MVTETITAVWYLQSNRQMYAWVGMLYIIPFILQHKLLPRLCYHFAPVNGKSVAELQYLRPTEHQLYLKATPIGVALAVG